MTCDHCTDAGGAGHGQCADPVCVCRLCHPTRTARMPVRRCSVCKGVALLNRSGICTDAKACLHRTHEREQLRRDSRPMPSFDEPTPSRAATSAGNGSHQS